MSVRLQSHSEGKGYPPRPESIPPDVVRQGSYTARFARDQDELDAILRLRYRVFNLELGEGLDGSSSSGRDEDGFDETCHHLLVQDRTGVVIGTYRMQSAEMASAGSGFYSAGEFDLAAVTPDVLGRSIEVGRACIDREHRNRSVLFLLWKGLARYLSKNEKRFLFGCCSLTSQEPAVGLRAARQLHEAGHRHESLWVSVQPGLGCVAPVESDTEVELPILFKTYLRYGARICSPPALDRDFKTIDFLVFFDVESLDERTRQLFFS